MRLTERSGERVSTQQTARERVRARAGAGAGVGTKPSARPRERIVSFFKVVVKCLLFMPTHITASFEERHDAQYKIQNKINKINKN